MSTHLDPTAQSGSSGRMKARPPVDPPRASNPSFEDVQVQWFARTGPFPAGNPTPPPPRPSSMPPIPSVSHPQGSDDYAREDEAMELADEDLDEDIEEAEVDVALDSLVDPQEMAASGEQDTRAHRASYETEHEPDEELDTLVTNTRPFLRARVWGSED